MSKQEDAKNKQGCTTELKTCGNCGNRKFDLELAKWMQESNAVDISEGREPRYGDGCREEKNMRCRIGGFAVKKTATCNQWFPRIVISVKQKE